MTQTAYSRYRRRVPDDATILADHAAGETLISVARRYGVHPQTVYQHWSRLGLSGAGRLDGYKMSERANFRARPEVAQMPAPYPDRLSLTDLALAVRLAREVGLPPRVAVSWVRADIVEAEAARPVQDDDAVNRDLLTMIEGAEARPQ